MLAVTAALALLAACGAPRSTPPELPMATADVERQVVTVADAGSVPDVVAATDYVGATMLASAPLEGNVVVSPASAVVALSMLAEGAREETAASLDEVLGAVGPERTAAVGALLAALQAHDGDPATVQADELPEEPLAHVANQVVVDDQADIHDAYLEALGRVRRGRAAHGSRHRRRARAAVGLGAVPHGRPDRGVRHPARR
ncbi:serpin family protein [Cellulosimicrobium cellulans]|uniref:serpin family protein n=1 Tax=Cellulosimicrobium cellulans TaxID=1710 RepID=UPI000849582B|nr:serpin family protein [Cellulosimicrobium cellulans]